MVFANISTTKPHHPLIRSIPEQNPTSTFNLHPEDSLKSLVDAMLLLYKINEHYITPSNIKHTHIYTKHRTVYAIHGKVINFLLLDIKYIRCGYTVFG